jgi:4-hydroxybenzoate polyprenyltransferase
MRVNPMYTPRARRAWGGRMAKLDSAKEELGWLKVLFAVVVAIDTSLAAWVAQAYHTATRTLLVLALVAITVLSAAVIWINRLAYRRIRELEIL